MLNRYTSKRRIEGSNPSVTASLGSAVDQLLRLTVRLAQLVRGRTSRGKLILIAVAILSALIIGVGEKLGFWGVDEQAGPPGRTPRVQPL